jgi:hypothetical protein
VTFRRLWGATRFYWTFGGGRANILSDKHTSPPDRKWTRGDSNTLATGSRTRARHPPRPVSCFAPLPRLIPEVGAHSFLHAALALGIEGSAEDRTPDPKGDP